MSAAARQGPVGGVPVDIALIQPLVYRVDTWLALRKRLPPLFVEGARRGPALSGATLHLAGDGDPLFDRSLDAIDHLTAAFPAILRQTRDFPFLVLPLERPSSDILADDGPAGLALETAETRFLIGRNGELVLLHLASGTMDPEAWADPARGLQREIRTQYRTALERPDSAPDAALERVIEEILGRPPDERVGEALEESGGHLVTYVASADPKVVVSLERVHRIQEGTARNERDLLLPAEPDEPCWAHFGWAYTTIATPDRALGYRTLMPLVAVNLAWYRYRELRADIIEISKAIHGLETDRDLTAQTTFYNEVVLETKIWEAERETFERGLRPVYRSVYDRLWEYWDTDESRRTVHEGIDYLRDFLDRKYNVKIALRENTQSKILFVIAIFQLVSIFGLVSGYLYFWEKTRLPEAAIFESEIMVWATLLSPVVVLVIIAWLLWSFFRRHR